MTELVLWYFAAVVFAFAFLSPGEGYFAEHNCVSLKDYLYTLTGLLLKSVIYPIAIVLEFVLIVAIFIGMPSFIWIVLINGEGIFQ